MDDKWEIISNLNLNSVHDKFSSKKSWWWHFRHSSKLIERQYRQFLYLIVANPGHTVVPWSQDLDDFWHEHILDTAKYARDCQTINGSVIHHNPHLPKGSLTHTRASTDTRQLYRTAFKEKAIKKRNRSTSCGAGCSADMPVVYCGSSSGHHSDGGSHHGGDSGHGGGGHGGGHGCGGHGCGGHGCGGHGCGGGGCGGGH